MSQISSYDQCQGYKKKQLKINDNLKWKFVANRGKHLSLITCNVQQLDWMMQMRHSHVMLMFGRRVRAYRVSLRALHLRPLAIRYIGTESL